jgi:hypothetical protein
MIVKFVQNYNVIQKKSRKRYNKLKNILRETQTEHGIHVCLLFALDFSTILTLSIIVLWLLVPD